MQIGTVRPEEARIFNRHEGFHRFHDDAGEEYGSFEIFWHDGQDSEYVTEYDADTGQHETLDPGWYWWACFPGCLPDGDAMGPAASSLDAMLNADELHPDYLDDES